ncbi:MAG: 1-(5-phosphoribosyl)-5-[(5-phosphoribosylamino)methylideneamino]imidazole-4-carboxamide isomerase [Kofleriaceae bacterium]|nr:1-(5-phosphoribosyl)-5-[(5-phosphoribosylamino)methylideneamino]imidazole-4-carboxamide isomerase [Kofleriaceae bacterium]
MIIPAIDLKDSAVVRLERGDFDTAREFSRDPLAVLRSFAEQGAQTLHVVDLDGARDGVRRQKSLIANLVAESSLRVQVGGGVRSLSDVRDLLNVGVSRVVVGSTAVEDPALVASWAKELGADKIVIALDLRVTDEGLVPQVRGWQSASEQSVEGLLRFFLRSGLKNFLMTDVDKDGMLEGPNFELYRQVLDGSPGACIQASGGVRSLQDLRDLRKLGIQEAIVGMALYEERFTVAEALQC